jgi:DNA-binding response OmpR family regulator
MVEPVFLIVEDHEDIRNLLGVTLNSLGCQVEMAENGEQAMSMLDSAEKAKKYDAIFLDIMMPVMNGYEVLEALKGKEYTREIPVIMLTAKGSGDDIIEGYKYGADYYIPKPFTRDQIVYGLDIVFSDEEAKDEPDPIDITAA